MKALKVMATAAVATAVLATGTISASAATGSIKSDAGADFVAGKGGTDPRDPYNPDVIVTPENPVPDEDGNITGGNEGPASVDGGGLSLDYASSLYFGSNEISPNTMTYHAYPINATLPDGTVEPRPNYVQVTDLRGTGAGWRLTVSQDAQFASVATTKELAGAQVTIGAGVISREKNNTSAAPEIFTSALQLNPTTHEAVEVMKAKAKTPGAANENPTGLMTTIAYFDTDQTVEDMSADATFAEQYANATQKLRNKDVTLEVPGTSAKETAQYRTKLTWTLADTPS